MATYLELQEQIRALQVQADSVRKQEVTAVVSDIRSKMQQYGLTVNDISPRGPKAGQTVAPKYRDPATGATWTGRGKPPRWLATELVKGRSKTEFLIV
jgi:DNA-binding protein H-NS